MSETFSDYKRGLADLLARLGRNHPNYAHVLTLQSRLQENIAQTREYGDTETRRAERAQIVQSLNHLALKVLDTSFNELCGLPPPLDEWAIPPCPYRGLLAFREEDAPFFFGREVFTDRLLESVECHPLTVVLGASGSGKSSVVLSGLLPRLRSRPDITIATLHPGREPFQELAAALLSLLEPEMTQTDRLLEVPKLAAGLQEGEITLDRLTRALLEKQGREQLLVVIDQFEELYTLCADEEVRRAFLDRWLEALALERSPLRLLLTLRADFLGQVLAYRPFADALDQAEKLLLGPMSPEELQAVVVKPAERLEVFFEQGLENRILDDVGQEPGRLPLLEFALTQLWERQERGRLTHRAYEDIGGVEGALVQYADQEYETFSKVEQAGVRQVLTQLVQPGEGTEDTRRRATQEELGAERWALVRRLADARLVVTSQDAAGHEVSEVAHEALIGRWGRLRGWMAEDREFRTWQERLRAALRGWQASDRDEGALLRGAPLAQAQEWLAQRGEEVEKEAHVFILASEEQVERERAARERLRRRITLGLLVGLVVMVLLAVVAWGQRNLATYEADVRATAQAEAEAEADLRSTAQAEAEAEADLRATAQAEAEAETDLRATAQAETEVQRQEADRQRWVALAHQWAAVGQLEFDRIVKGPLIGTALGIESLRITPSLEGDQLIRRGLALLPRLVIQVQHDSNVGAVAFSPDGQWVVSGSGDGTVRVWEVATGQELARMQHDESVYAVAFSPDGRWVVSGGCEKYEERNEVWGCTQSTVRVWEVATGQELARMQHEGSVRVVAFSPDGRWVLSWVGNTAQVWDAATGQELARLQHDDGVSSVAFSPDGLWVVSGSWDGTARVWDAATGQELARMEHDDWVWAVAFSPDGQWVVSGGNDNTARVWEAATGQELVRMQHDESVYAVAFSLDGRWVVSISFDGTIQAWEAATGQKVAQVEHDGSVWEAAFSPDGRWVVITGCEQSTENLICLQSTAQVWDVATGQKLARIQYDGEVYAVAFSPDGRWVVSGSEDDTARVWEITTGQELPRMQHDDGVTSVVFSPDGQWVVSGSYDGTVRVWDATTGQELDRMQHSGGTRVVAFSPDGQWVVSGSYDGTVRVWEADTRQELVRMQHDNRVNSVAFSPDGQWVVSGSDDDTVRVWEAATGQELARIQYDSWVWAVAFSPDGQWVVSGGRFMGGMRVWEVAIGREVATRREVAQMQHGGRLTSVAFSPNGRWVVSGSVDNTARVWEAATGQEVARVEHEGIVYAVAFSPDGQWVVSGSADDTVRVWEAATGQELARMQHGGGVGVGAVAFSPDGRWVVSGSWDGTVRVWLWWPEDLIAEACRRLPRNLTEEEWEQYIGPDIPYRATCPDLPLPKE